MFLIILKFNGVWIWFALDHRKTVVTAHESELGRQQKCLGVLLTGNACKQNVQM